MNGRDCVIRRGFGCLFWFFLFPGLPTVQLLQNWLMMDVNASQHIPFSDFTYVIILLKFTCY